MNLPRREGGGAVARAYENRPVPRIGWKRAMGSLHEGNIGRDEIHQHPKPEFFCQQFLRDFQLRRAQCRVDEQLERIVAVLAVDIDAAGEVRRFRVVIPVVVTEPGSLPVYRAAR